MQSSKILTSMFSLAIIFVSVKVFAETDLAKELSAILGGQPINCQSCSPMKVAQLNGEWRGIKVARFNAEDHRRDPNLNDTAVNSTGTIWCETRMGLELRGSATTNKNEVVYDRETGVFHLETWEDNKHGDVITLAAHSLFRAVRVKIKKTGKRYTASLPHKKDCYFYPKGQHPPRRLVTDLKGTFYYSVFKHVLLSGDIGKHKINSESRYKLKFRYVKSKHPFDMENDAKPDSRYQEDWAVAVLDGFPSKRHGSTPILNLSKTGYFDLLTRYKNKTKAYGFNTEKWKINVASEDCRAYPPITTLLIG